MGEAGETNVSHEYQRLYRMLCEAGMKEAADLLRELSPYYHLPYDAERRIIAAYKNERAA